MTAFDTLPKIALKFDATPSQLSRLNKLAIRTLYPGQVLSFLGFVIILSMWVGWWWLFICLWNLKSNQQKLCSRYAWAVLKALNWKDCEIIFVYALTKSPILEQLYNFKMVIYLHGFLHLACLNRPYSKSSYLWKPWFISKCFSLWPP